MITIDEMIPASHRVKRLTISCSQCSKTETFKFETASEFVKLCLSAGWRIAPKKPDYCSTCAFSA